MTRVNEHKVHAIGLATVERRNWFGNSYRNQLYANDFGTF